MDRGIAGFNEREQAELHRKAAAYDRLVAWISDLQSVGVAGRFIAPDEILAVLEGK